MLYALVAPTCRFHPLQISHTCRFYLLADFTNLQISPTSDFTYLQISSTCTCLVLWLWWLALSVFAVTSFWPTVFFHPLYRDRRNQLSPTMLYALVAPTCRFYLLVHFTHLQISPACRFHPLADFTHFRFHLFADFIYLHLSCVMTLMISLVCVRCHGILTHCFLSPTVPWPQKSIVTHDALRSGCAHLQISPTSDFTHLQILPACRFHQLADFTNIRFHLLADFIYLHLSCVMTLMISLVCVRCHVILTHCFLSPAVSWPQKSIVTHDALRSGCTHL